jgi:hypothetical protein
VASPKKQKKRNPFWPEKLAARSKNTNAARLSFCRDSPECGVAHLEIFAFHLLPFTLRRGPNLRAHLPFHAIL